LLYYAAKVTYKNLVSTALILAAVNISLGVLYAVFDWYWVLIWFCILGFCLGVFILIETRNYMHSIQMKQKLKKALGEDDDENQFNADNISKTGSTQHLTSTSMNSSRMRDDISMEPLRYTPSNIGNKLAPQTPPPPYFNRNKKWSNLKSDSASINIHQTETDDDDGAASSSFHTSSNKVQMQPQTQMRQNAYQPRSTHMLAYSQQVNSSFRDDFDMNCDVVSQRSGSTFNSHVRVNVRQAFQMQPQTQYHQQQQVHINESVEQSPASSYKVFSREQQPMPSSANNYFRSNNNILNNNARY
jgi:hypothetical protein